MWFKKMAKVTWQNQVSPFGALRFLGKRQFYELMGGYVERKWMPSGNIKEEHKERLIDYLYQI